MGLSEYIFIIVFFGVPGLVGAYLAHTRGKSSLLWGLLSAPFPFFVFILWIQKPDREILGYFKKCPSCGGIIAWKQITCKYCGAQQRGQE